MDYKDMADELKSKLNKEDHQLVNDLIRIIENLYHMKNWLDGYNIKYK